MGKIQWTKTAIYCDSINSDCSRCYLCKIYESITPSSCKMRSIVKKLNGCDGKNMLPSGQAKILNALLQEDYAVTNAYLSKAMGGMSLGAQINILESKGFIKREPIEDSAAYRVYAIRDLMGRSVSKNRVLKPGLENTLSKRGKTKLHRSNKYEIYWK